MSVGVDSSGESGSYESNVVMRWCWNDLRVFRRENQTVGYDVDLVREVEFNIAVLRTRCRLVFVS